MGGRGQSENFPGLIRPSNAHGTQTGQNRRALSAIDINVINNQKRGVLAEENAASKKNPIVPLHRPVTRRFAAQLVVKEKQEVKPNQTSDCVVVDAEDDVPMFVQHTEAMLVEIDRMDAEVEMEENIDEDEAMMDVDASDKKNPLAVTEYINDIYAFYKKTESSSCVPPNYMVQQPDINDRMRGILIDWLIEVHYRFELMDETLYLTVNLIDRFLAVRSIERKRLQLVGVTAMLLACKYEEVSVPVVEDLVLISDRAYSRAEVLDMEKLMINTLQFNLSLPTPYAFMRRFLKAAESEKRLEPLSYFILELCLVEYEMLRFRPSHLAAAAIFTAQCTLSRSEIWSRTCQCHTSYTKDQLMECARMMVALHQNAGSGKLTGVYKKYSTSKFGYAAKMEPAVFLKEQQQ